MSKYGLSKEHIEESRRKYGGGEPYPLQGMA